MARPALGGTGHWPTGAAWGHGEPCGLSCLPLPRVSLKAGPRCAHPALEAPCEALAGSWSGALEGPAPMRPATSVWGWDTPGSRQEGLERTQQAPPVSGCQVPSEQREE